MCLIHRTYKKDNLKDKDMNLSILLSNMRIEQRYTVPALYMMYLEIMNRDEFVCQAPATQKTLRNNLAQWCKVPGGSLRSERKGRIVIYYLEEPKMSKFYDAVEAMFVRLKCPKF